MTKTIKNITPRAVGDTFDVAYLTDLSAIGSDLSTKIEHIRNAIGGSEWELSSEALTFGSDLNYIGNGSYSIKGAFENLDTNLVSDIGTDNDYGSQHHYIDSTNTVKQNISTLDGAIGKLGADGNWITSSNNTVNNLLALDDAIGAYSDGYTPAFIDLDQSICANLETIDVTLSDLSVGNETNWVHIGYLEVGNGSYYVEGQAGYEWQFPSAATYLSAAGDLTEALSSLNLGLENAAAAGEVTLSATAGTGGLLSVYTLYQGGTAVSNVVGTINIPKDFLVKSAALSTVTTENVPYQGAHVGDKYIDFVINAKDSSETAEHIYLPVNDLVDVYTGGSNSEVAVAIDSSNVVTATLVDSGVTTAKIADGAINTDKIKLIDTADSSKAYTLQVTNGRLQVREIANS